MAISSAEDWLKALEHPDSRAMCRTIGLYPDDDTPKHIWFDWLDERAPDADTVNSLRMSLDAGKRINVLPACHPDICTYRGRFDAPFGLRGSSTRRLCLTGAVGCIDFFRWPSFAAIDELPIEGIACDALYANFAIHEILSRPAAAKLKTFRISGVHDDRSRVEFVVGATESLHLSNLRELKIDRSNLTPTYFASLARSAVFANLESLTIQQSHFVADEFFELAAPSGFPNLVSLRIVTCRIGTRRALELLNSPKFPKLSQLTLEADTIDEDGAIALSESPALSKLEVLNLHYSPIGRKGAEAIKASPHFRGKLGYMLGRWD